MPRGREKSGPRLSHAERAKQRRRMALEVKNGASLAAVALRHQVTLPTVRNACREHKVRWQNGPGKVKKIDPAVPDVRSIN